MNGADACSTSDASPVGIPVSIAMNRNANCPVPNPRPYPSRCRTFTFGHGTNRIVGTAITANRSAPANTGGNWPSVAWMARKLRPQRTATSTAIRRSRVGMPPL